MHSIDIPGNTVLAGFANRQAELAPIPAKKASAFVGQMMTAEAQMKPVVQDSASNFQNSVTPQELSPILANAPQSFEVVSTRDSNANASTALGCHSGPIGAQLVGTVTCVEQPQGLIKSAMHEVSVDGDDVLAVPDDAPEASSDGYMAGLPAVHLSPISETQRAPSPEPQDIDGGQAKLNEGVFENGILSHKSQDAVRAMSPALNSTELPGSLKSGRISVDPNPTQRGDIGVTNWPDTHDRAPFGDLTERFHKNVRPVEKLAHPVATIRQLIDYNLTPGTSDRLREPLSGSSPSIISTLPETIGAGVFQNSLEAQPEVPNTSTFASALSAINAKTPPETSQLRTDAPVTPSEFSEPFSDERVRVVQTDTRTIRLFADVDNLGKMAISLSMFENGTEVAFRTESAETARHLHNAGSQLATRLDESGGRLSRVTVEMSDHGGLSNGFAQDGSRQTRSSENWTGQKGSQSSALGLEIEADAGIAPQNKVRLA